jgi:hypothetical protein
MLQLTPQSTIFIATTHVDFRKGIDGLAAFCRQKLQIEPLDGALFLFYNNARNTIKVLAYEGQGYFLLIKRLSKGKFIFNINNALDKNSTHQRICHRILNILLNNGNPDNINIAEDWRSLSSKD